MIVDEYGDEYEHAHRHPFPLSSSRAGVMQEAVSAELYDIFTSISNSQSQ